MNPDLPRLEGRRLFFRGEAIKNFTKEKRGPQERILEYFEDRLWPDESDIAPLDLDYEQLTNAVKNLNKNQRPSQRLVFTRQGTVLKWAPKPDEVAQNSSASLASPGPASSPAARSPN